MGFVETLKLELTGSEKTPFVYLGNIEVEQHWANAIGALKLPEISAASKKALVNRMEELAVLLADKNDTVILKSPMDPSFANYLKAEFGALPKIVTVEHNQPELNISENILKDPATLAAIKQLGLEGAKLIPFGVSVVEEDIAKQTGIALATNSAEVNHVVNSKIYSRKLNADLGIREIPGACAENIDTLLQAIERFSGSTVVVKEAFGVSGKGLVVLDTPEKTKSFSRLIARQAANKPDKLFRFVVESWVSKKMDFNYQFLIGKSGSFTFLGVRDAITDHGVHQGHRIPTTLSSSQTEEVVSAAKLLATRLYRDGFFGVVGVDGILSSDNVVYPNLEINARFNMSTYQNRIVEEVLDKKTALAKNYGLSLTKPISFAELEEALGSLLYRKSTGRGFLVSTFSTMTAGAIDNLSTWPARLYGLLIGDSFEEVMTTDGEVSERLKKLTQGAK